MRKFYKIIFAVLILISIVIIVPNNTFAATIDLNSFNDKGNGRVDGMAQDIMKTMINVIRIVGTAASIITLTYLGMTYMMKAPEERAEFKKSATIYITGAILVFASSNILGLIYKFANANLKW